MSAAAFELGVRRRSRRGRARARVLGDLAGARAGAGVGTSTCRGSRPSYSAAGVDPARRRRDRPAASVCGNPSRRPARGYLPLATGDDAPEAGDVDGAIAAANRNQSRTTVFLAQLARKAFPDSDFCPRGRGARERPRDSVRARGPRLSSTGRAPASPTPYGAFAAVSENRRPRARCERCCRASRRACHRSCAGSRGSATTAWSPSSCSPPTRRSCPGALPALIG